MRLVWFPAGAAELEYEIEEADHVFAVLSETAAGVLVFVGTTDEAAAVSAALSDD